MPDTTFNLIFRGQISPGAQLADVQRKVSQLLKIDDAKAELLFDGRTIVVKRNLGKGEAERYKAAFDATGAVSVVEPAESASGPFVGESPVSPKPETSPVPVPAKKSENCEDTTAERKRQTPSASRARKQIYVIVGIVAGIALIGVAPVLIKGAIRSYVFPKISSVMDKLWVMVEAEKQEKSYADAWITPSDNAGDEFLFPPSVTGFTLAAGGADAPHALLKDLPGRFGTYTNGSQRIVVSVYRASELEKEAIYTRMKNDIEKNTGGMRKWSGGTNYYKYFYSFTEPRHESGALWWSKSWLIYFRSDSDLELAPFLRAYLDAISGKGR